MIIVYPCKPEIYKFKSLDRYGLPCRLNFWSLECNDHEKLWYTDDWRGAIDKLEKHHKTYSEG